MTDGILPPPSYFFEDAKINKNGYDSVEQVMKNSNRSLSVSEFEEVIQKGALILDTRKADDFEKGFIPGAINIGLNGQYAIWVGTLIDIQQPLVLVAEPGTEHESILRLARVGYENVRGFLAGGINGWKKELEKIHSIQPDKMKNEINRGAEVIDVRKPGEWSVSHVKNAVFLPLSGMTGNLKSMDKTKHYLVHCGGGYRSMTAISLMKRQGFTSLTNIYGGFGAILNSGVEVATEETAVDSL